MLPLVATISVTRGIGLTRPSTVATGHIEIVGEKNTIEPIIRPVAARSCIPMTIGRGYCSLRPHYDIAQRFHKSGKDRLVLLMLSDHDPDSEEIAHSSAISSG